MPWVNYNGYDNVMGASSVIDKSFTGGKLDAYDKNNVSVTFFAGGENYWTDKYEESDQSVDLGRTYRFQNLGSHNFTIGEDVPTGMHIIRSCAYFTYIYEDQLLEDQAYDLRYAIRIAYVTETMTPEYETIPNFDSSYQLYVERYTPEWIDGHLVAVPPDEPTIDTGTMTVFELDSNYSWYGSPLTNAYLYATITLPLFKNEEEAIHYLLTGEGEPIEPTPEPDVPTEGMKTYYIKTNCYKSLDGTKGEKQLVYTHYQSFKVNESCEMARYDVEGGSATEPLTQFWKYQNLETVAPPSEYSFKGVMVWKEYNDVGEITDEGTLETPHIEDMINPYHNHEELKNGYFSIIDSNIPYVKDPSGWGGDTPTPPKPPTPTGDDEPGTDLPDIEFHHIGSTAHLLNYQQVNNFMSVLYTSDTTTLQDILDGLKMYGENPINAIIEMYYLPFDVRPFCNYKTSDTIPLGSYNASVNNIEITQSNKRVTIADTLIGAQYNDFRDFDSTYYLYLPYVGIIEFDFIKYYNQTLKIEMAYDIYTGNIKYYCFGNGLLKDMYEGSVKVTMALCGTDKSTKSWDVVNGVANFLGASVGMGVNKSMGSVGGYANSLLSLGETMSKAPTKHLSGNNSPSTAIFDPMYPYLIIENPDYIKPINLNLKYGYPDNDVNTIGSRSGYIECMDVHLSTSATETEQNEIIQLLQTGVFV